MAPAAKRGLSTGAIVGIACGGVALVLVIAGAVVVGFFVFGNDTVRFRQGGGSMEPAIQAGQTVSATKVEPGKYRPKRGDIVVFEAPAAWVAGPEDKQLMKRVIGLPGERLACCDPQGRWMVGGTPLDEPYVVASAPREGFDIAVPAGRLWVMGDNRRGSGDSRTMFAMSREIEVATIPVSSVVAVVKT